MSDNSIISNVIDRLDETVVTHQPGYAATEHVVHDVATERRLRWYYVNRIIWTVLGVLEILLGLHFVLRFIAANPNAGFAKLLYDVTAPFLRPFASLIVNPSSSDGMVLEITTLFAMAVYALFVWIVCRVVEVIADRPNTRRVIRSIHEQIPDGLDGTDERTINTVSSH